MRETSIRELLLTTTEKLKAVNESRARYEARLLLAHLLHQSPEFLIANDERKVPQEIEREFLELVGRRLQFEPLAYILGRKEFFGLNFEVTRDVLIPRPESEELVEKTLEWAHRKKNLRIIDIGTGTGCLALALRAHLPDAEITALDVSEKALTVARRNAENLKLPLSFVKADIFVLNALPGAFDIIISNPPYIPTEMMETLQSDIRNFEPRGALDGGENGLRFYGVIVNLAKNHLVSGGLLALESLDGEQQDAIDRQISAVMNGETRRHGPHLFFERSKG